MLEAEAETKVEELTPKAVDLNEWDELEIDTRAVVAASNRTTHAVRSLVLFLFISICTAIPGAALIIAGTQESLRCYYGDCGAGQMFFGWAISGVGFLVALIVGMVELSNSKVPTTR